MPQVDTKILASNIVRYYTAPVGTDIPTIAALAAGRFTAITNPWDELGNTDLSAPLSSSKEGGEMSSKGTLQNANAKTSVTDVKITLDVKLQQFDGPSVRKYVGDNAVKEDGLLYAQAKPKATTRALFAIAADAEGFVPLHYPKVDMLGGDGFSIENADDIDGLPIKISVLEDSASPGLYGMGEYTPWDVPVAP